MVNKKFWSGMLVMILAFGMMVVGCELEDPQKFPATRGKLTINGLGGFGDGYYVYVSGMAGSSALVGITDITGYPSDTAYKLAKTSGGRAEVPLYTANPYASSYADSYDAYSGNDPISSLNIYILNDGSLREYNAASVTANVISSNPDRRRILTSGTFSRGNYTVNWGTIGGTWPPSNPTSLTANQWASGNIPTSSGEQWFRFTATAATQYIHVTLGTLTYLYVQIYSSSGSTVGNNVSLQSNNLYASRSLTLGDIYYIKVSPYSSSYSGAYQIAFNTSITPPSTWTPPSNPTSLTANQWRDDTMSGSTTETWYSFFATSGTQYYIWWNDAGGGDGTKTKDIKVSGYSSGGTEIFTDIDSAWSSPRSFTASSGGTVYLKVTPYFSSSGTYAIVYSTSSTRPSSSSGGTWTPPSSSTLLTANQWASGNISSSSGEQWFRFTATASTQYIHVTPGTLTNLYVQVYNSSGSTVGSNVSLNSSNRYTSQSLTSGQTYYIKVSPYSGSGNYQIAFNTSSTAPSSSTGGGGTGSHDIDSSLYGTWNDSTGSMITATFSSNGITWGGTVGNTMNKEGATWTAKNGTISYTWSGGTDTLLTYTINSSGNLVLATGYNTLTLVKSN